MSSIQQALLMVSGGAPPLTYMYLDMEVALGYAKLSGGGSAVALYPTGTVTFSAGPGQDDCLPPPGLDPGPALNGLFPGSVYAARAALGTSWTITLGGAFDNLFYSINYDFLCNTQVASVELFDASSNSLGFQNYVVGTNMLWLYNESITSSSAAIHSIAVTAVSGAAWPCLDNIRFNV
jgi:hypothetical protein